MSGFVHLASRFKVRPRCGVCPVLYSSCGQIYSIVWVDYISFICSPVGRHLGCCCFLTVVTNGAVNIRGQDFVWTDVFNSLGEIPRNGIAASCCNSGFNIFEDLNFVTSEYRALVITPCWRRSWMGAGRSGCEEQSVAILFLCPFRYFHQSQLTKVSIYTLAQLPQVARSQRLKGTHR